MSKRTTEELIAHREEQNRKARLRLARAKDPRIDMIEETIANLTRLEDDDAWPTDEDRGTLDALAVMRDRLVAEATK